ncbi:MAG: alcohol dehydrogenase catalytic domain-containing protein, partial [Planctomycetes bacterium]|nr:alcohol dehydrogenase catalytic domain-containing protein [Planctomycetota bacterium]
MLAIAHDRYGPPDTLQLVERERPRLRRSTDVLLRVHAASLHVADSFVVRGSPGIVRLGFGLLRPRQPVVGQDCAGVVVEVGPAVQRLRPGN